MNGKSRTKYENLPAREQRSSDEAALKSVARAAEDFITARPWLAVAGTAILTGVFTAISENKRIRRNSSRAALRDWLDDAHESLPTKKQLVSVAKSAGLPTTLKDLHEKAASLKAP
jgi:hypothetical protein